MASGATFSGMHLAAANKWRTRRNMTNIGAVGGAWAVGEIDLDACAMIQPMSVTIEIGRMTEGAGS